jgi:hypothetical protein
MSAPWFQDMFGGGEPQRRVLKARLARDAQGKLVIQPLEGQAHVISADDSLDTVNLEVDAFFDCGCSIEGNRPGCHCCEPGCAHVVCTKHLARCQVCGKGLCPQCLHSLQAEPDGRIDLCQTHHRAAVRRRFWQRVARTALGPFVVFDDHQEPK